MSAGPSANAPLVCPRCGNTIDPGALACPHCGALVYATRLEQLAAEATYREQIDPAAGADVWQACLSLLPQDSQQAEMLRQRIAQLRAVAAARGPAPLPYAQPQTFGPRNDPLPTALAKTLGSMALSIVVYTWTFHDWTVATGFVLLILVHEMGHVVADLYYGIRTSPPIFIPFIGAVINLRQAPPNAKVEAVIGIGGPIAGTLAAIACFVWYWFRPSELALILAWFGFTINLFNMLPVPPLDGGRVAAAMSPWIWIAGLVGLGWLVFEDFQHGHDFSILMIVLLMAVPRIIATLKSGGLHRGPYYQISRLARVMIAASYLALLIVLIAGRWYTQRQLSPGGIL